MTETVVWRIDEREDPFSREFPKFTGNRDVPESSVCASCGKCCLNMPGGFVPSDLEPGFDERVEAMLRSKKYAIDWWEDLEPVYFLRPATIRAPGVIFDPSWGGPCNLLGPQGCTLPREERPTVCKALEPTLEGGGCRNGMSKENLAAEWQGDYSRRLHEIGLRIDRE